jgi:hypothetical protein
VGNLAVTTPAQSANQADLDWHHLSRPDQEVDRCLCRLPESICTHGSDP